MERDQEECGEGGNSTPTSFFFFPASIFFPVGVFSYDMIAQVLLFMLHLLRASASVSVSVSSLPCFLVAGNTAYHSSGVVGCGYVVCLL